MQAAIFEHICEKTGREQAFHIIDGTLA